MGSLFRREAIEGQRQAWLGSIWLIRPLSLTLLTGFMVGSAAALLAFMVFGQYTHKTPISGVLAPDTEEVKLASPRAARVLEVHASEGQLVRQGDLLVVLLHDPADDVAPTTRRPAADQHSGTSAAEHGTAGAAAERVLIVAPQDGVLTALLARPGQGVAPGAPLARFEPTAVKLQAQLFAPASVLGFLRPEQALQLRYEAYPYQRFGHQPGRILQVARSPVQASEMAGQVGSSTVTRAGTGGVAAGPTASEPLYRVTVALDQQTVSGDGLTLPLAPGMRLEADVALDRRRLIDWLFEPVFGRASGG